MKQLLTRPRQVSRFNTTTFRPVTTDRLRLEVIPEAAHAAAILEWQVFSARNAPSLPPVVNAGLDRSVVMGGQTYLAGKAVWLHDMTSAETDPFVDPAERGLSSSDGPDDLQVEHGACLTLGKDGLLISGMLRHSCIAW